jgi:hypothetical protein
MEMDLCESYPRHNHDKHHYCTRQGASHAPFISLRATTSSGSSTDQTIGVNLHGGLENINIVVASRIQTILEKKIRIYIFEWKHSGMKNEIMM